MPAPASNIKSQAEVRDELQKMEELKLRAARQAAKDLANPIDIPTVEVTILPLGADKIGMGIHIAGIGDAFYEEGETLTIQLPIAITLYERGYVNFEGAKEAVDKVRAARRRAAQAAYDAMDPDVRSALYTGAQ